MARRFLLVRPTLCVAALITLVAFSLPAQIVQGTVSDGGTSAPIRGAVIVGIQESGPVAPRVLSNIDGHFAWRAPGAGSWTLEIRAIGYIPARRPVALGAGETVRLNVALERAALSLANVRVQERSSCRARTDLTADASTLWNDIWSALAGAVASRDVSHQALRITHYVRTRQPTTGVVDWEERTSSRAQTTRPFLAVAAAELARTGFRIEHDDGSITFHAPDAETLIAPEFIARHCYGMTRADTGTRPLIGVAFWPHRGSEPSEVEGVLWVDAKSRELRTVEFHYPALRDLDGGASRFGGFASYARQPDGSWIIYAWQIRVPVVSRSRRVIGVGNRRFGEDVRDSVVQISEEGGFAAAVDGGRQFGIVTGSVHGEDGHPEPSVSVELIGTTVTTVTDSLGAFKLPEVLPGRYLARAYRGSLDARASFLTEAEIEVPLGDSLSWNPVVTERASMRTACRERSDRNRDAAIEIILRDAISQRPLRFHPLQFLVTSLTGGSVTRLQRHEETLERTSDWRGEIALCDVPPLAELRMREPTATTWSFPMRLRATFTAVDVDVDAEAGMVNVLSASDPANSLNAPGVRAPSHASLVGRLVSDDSTARPLVGAEVTAEIPVPSLRDNSAGIAVTPGVASRPVRTDSAGTFRFNNLPLGIVMVRARFVGYLPVQRVLLLDEAVPDTLVIRLSRTATVLAPVTVVAEAGSARVGMREFAMRREAHFGIFLDSNDIERTRARTLGSVIASSAAGLDLIKVLPKGLAGSGYAVASKRYHNFSGKKCFSQVILNGVRVYPEAAASDQTSEPFVIDQIDPRDVIGIEIYRGASDTPLQFGGPSASCGTVVIWTK